MFAEFRDFIAKGNVMELAVAVIIAGAFGVIVASMTNDLIMPLVGAIFGDVDFSSKYVVLSGEVKEGMSLEAAFRKVAVEIGIQELRPEPEELQARFEQSGRLCRIQKQFSGVLQV